MASVMAIDHGRRRTDRAGLAAALDAERVGRARRRVGRHLEHRKIPGPRHGVVHVGRGHELAGIVVMGAFEDRLADALRDTPMHLTLDDHRVDDIAEIVCRDELDDLGRAGLRVDLDLADVGAGREGEVSADRRNAPSLRPGSMPSGRLWPV